MLEVIVANSLWSQHSETVIMPPGDDVDPPPKEDNHHLQSVEKEQNHA